MSELDCIVSEFAPIIAYDAIKQELIRIADVLKNSSRYKELGVMPPRGLLLYGKPGTGKTLMANCLIKASGRQAFTCRRVDSDKTFIETLKNTFEEAKEHAPSIVFLDDMDKFANSDYMHPDEEEFVAVQGCIDNMHSFDVFVLATANENVRNLPDSLLRPGRFDRQIEIDVPCGEDAARIIKNYLSNKSIDEDIDTNLVASMMAGHSCATLETVVNEAGIIAAYSQKQSISLDDMVEACLRVVYQVPAECLYESDDVDLEKSTTKSIVVWHEAGHALAHELLTPGSVALVSAKSKSTKNEHSGFTVRNWSEPEDPYQAKRNEILACLAGKAAVEVALGIVDIGASSDISTAYQILAGLMGATCTHGFWLHSPKTEKMFGIPMKDSNSYGDEKDVSSMRQIVVGNMLEEYYAQVRSMIMKNKEFLSELAHELAKKSCLTSKDIAAIRARCSVLS